MNARNNTQPLPIQTNTSAMDRIRRYLKIVQEQGKYGVGSRYSDDGLANLINDFSETYLEGDALELAKILRNTIEGVRIGKKQKDGSMKLITPSDEKIDAIIEFLTNPSSDHRIIDRDLLLGSPKAASIARHLYAYMMNSMSAMVSPPILENNDYSAKPPHGKGRYDINFWRNKYDEFLYISFVGTRSEDDADAELPFGEQAYHGICLITPEDNLFALLKGQRDQANLHLLSVDIDLPSNNSPDNTPPSYFSAIAHGITHEWPFGDDYESKTSQYLAKNLLIFKPSY